MTQTSLIRPSSVSVLLTSYNAAQFIEEAIDSLLAQDCPGLEIIISDDQSTDGTWQQIERIYQAYRGDKSIIIHQNTQRLGVVGNFMQAFSLSHGEFIFNAGHDDISVPERIRKTMAFYDQKNQLYDLIASDAYDLDTNGTILGIKVIDDLEDWTLPRWFTGRPYFFGASFMMRRSLIAMRPLNPRLLYEDQVLVFRAILTHGACRLPEPLVCHRRGGLSQQIRPTYIPKTKRFGIHAKNEIIEFNQMKKDASYLGQMASFMQLGCAYIERSLYIYRLFKSHHFFHKIRLFRQAKTLLPKPRFQYLKYFLFPAWVNGVHDLKESWRSRINPKPQ